MHSFINIIHFNNNLPQEWYADADKCYNSLSLIDQGKFLVRQSMAINYLERIYHNPLPLLFTQYNLKITDTLKRYKLSVEANGKEDSYVSTVSNMACSICEFLLNKNNFPGLVSNDDIMYFMSDEDTTIPSIGPSSFYIPYIHFILSVAHTGLTEELVEYPSQYEVTIPNASIMLLDWNEPRNVHLRPVNFVKYQYDTSMLNKYYTAFSEKGSFLSYLSCMDLNDFELESILGMVASFTVEFDDNVITTAQSKFIKHLTMILFKKYDYSVKNKQNQSYYVLVNNCIKFLSCINEYYNVELTNRVLIAKILNGSENLKKLEDYLNNKTASTVSSEEYKAFKSSILASVKTLDVLSPSFEAMDDEDPEDDYGDDEDNPEEDDPAESDEPEKEPEEETPLLDKDEPSMEKLLFRETVRKHIDGILAEPEDRDEETLAVLKNLKVYWLNLLSQTTIETILVMTNSPVNCNIKNK